MATAVANLSKLSKRKEIRNTTHKKDAALKKILILLTISVLLAACSSDSDPAATNDGRRVPLQVTGYIADTPLGITRAFYSSWESGDEIGLYALPQGNTTTPIDGGSNVCYVTGSGGDTSGPVYMPFTTSTSITLPATGNIDVYGYYPYSDGATTPTAVAVNVSAQNSQKAIDLMATGQVSKTTHNGSTPISIANPSCELLFYHRLTKLVFNLNLSEMGTVGTTSLTIGSQKTTATYNIYTDKLTYSGEANQTISATVGTTTSSYDKTYEAIVLPNDATNNPAVDHTVTIVVDGRSYTFTIAASGASSSTKVVTSSFKAGEKYVYNVKVYPFTIEVDTDKYTEQW